MIARLDNMTISDYIMTMTRVNIADLKARLSEYLRQVRQGHVLTVYDRATPVARVMPYRAEPETLRVRHPLGRHASLQDVPLPQPAKLDFDVVELLLEERQIGR